VRRSGAGALLGGSVIGCAAKDNKPRSRKAPR
jgi:hypothetical protein